jgi:uncharacterized protein (TIGR02145 family)
MKNPFRISGVMLLFILIYSCTKEIEYSIKDIDGNDYNTVMIGTQVWMKENLKTSKYNDGEAIPLILDGTAWRNLFTEGCCWYENNIADSKKIYGLLYNWHTINTGKLCPKGWHVPTDDEWLQLISFLDPNALLRWPIESYVAGGMLKETGTINWTSPNPATNESGFTALPSGKSISGTSFFDEKEHGNFWATGVRETSPLDPGLEYYGWHYIMNFDNTEVNSFYDRYFLQLNSIRCIKNK